MAKGNVNVGSYMRRTKSGKMVRVDAYNQTRDLMGGISDLLKADGSRPSNNAKSGQFAGGSSVPGTSSAMQAAQKRVRAASAKAAAPKKTSGSKEQAFKRTTPEPTKKGSAKKTAAKKTAASPEAPQAFKRTTPAPTKKAAASPEAPAAKKAAAPKAPAAKKAAAPKAPAAKKAAAPAAKKAAAPAAKKAPAKKYTRDSFTPAQKKARIKALGKRLDETLKGGDTQARNSRIVETPNGDKVAVYTPERAQIHREIIMEMLDDARARGVPRENKAIVTGGLPGAGKSYVLENGLGIDSSQYVTLNPDDFKDAIAKRTTTPGTEDGKFSPLEMAGVLHEESSDLSKMARDVFESNGYNVILDVTLGGAGEKAMSKHRKTVEGLREKGYAVEGVFVDIPHQMSAESADNRYWGGYARWLNGEDDMGGRYVPPHVAAKDVSTRGFNSSNRDNFEHVKDLFSTYQIVDNSDRSKDFSEKFEESGRADNAPTSGTADRTRDPIAYLESLLEGRRSLASNQSPEPQDSTPQGSVPMLFDDLSKGDPNMSLADKVKSSAQAINRKNILPKTEAERVERSNAAAEPVLAAAAAMEPGVSGVLQSLVSKHDSLELEGFKHRLKTEESLKEKIARKSYDKQVLPEEYAGQISDALRYTLVSDNPDDAISNFEEALAALEAAGHKVRKVDNAWGPGNAYQGINVDMIAPNGLPWEIQLHTEDSYRLKSSNHKDYEIARATSSTPQQKREAHQRMVDSWSDVTYPKGWETFGTRR